MQNSAQNSDDPKMPMKVANLVTSPNWLQLSKAIYFDSNCISKYKIYSLVDGGLLCEIKMYTPTVNYV